MFIHMFFVNVQSCSVLNACYIWIRYSVIQSCFLSTMPPFSCGYFLRDFHDFLYSHTRSCLSQQPLSHRSALTTSWDVATRPLSVFSLRRRFRRCYLKALAYTAAQIVTSPHLRFWHDSLLPDGRHHHWLFDRTSGRLTVPSEPSSIANTAMHPHHRPSCILREPHPSETHACRSPTSSSRSLPPSALQPRLHGASHLKDSEHHHRVEHHFTPHTRSSAPHHRLLVSALFAASRASSMFCTILHPSR